MTKDIQKDPRDSAAVRFWPWLLGAAMFAVYWFTLNRWVTVLNLGQVAQVSGWVWQLPVYSPLTFLLTYPFRWLPTANIPIALNLFSALCAAATLALLARSVALLPHDRTEAERDREQSDFAFLTGWTAWFPPLLAVAVAGLQFTFWQHATSFTGETLNLLFFAFILWQLLEYRLDEKEWRLFAAALIYGWSMTENWALLAFLPVFVTMIIWLRKLDFFDSRFLSRMVLFGLVGLMFFLFLPLVAKFFGKYPVTIWGLLKPALLPDWGVLRAISNRETWHNLALLSLTTLLPLLVLSIRWNSSGDNSQIGTSLTNSMFHLINALLFGVCLWVMFDPPFSPHQLSSSFPFPFTGAPSLTLYYLAALSIGYFCGYFLLVFGKSPGPSRRMRRPEPALPPGLIWLCPLIVAATLAIGALAVGLLVYKNAPLIRTSNDDTLLKYAQFTTQNLPRTGAILLVDSDNPGQNQVLRSFLVQAMLTREGRAKDFPVLDTRSLDWEPYHRFLHERYPDKWPLLVKPSDLGAVNPAGLLAMLNMLSQSNHIYYLNPSFGYYFEQFYQEPHGLLYALKQLPDDTLLPPALDKKLIEENEAFWSQVTPSVEPAITRALNPPDPKKAIHNFADWLLLKLHTAPEPNINAILTGMFYSRSLDFWGVELQRANELDLAAAQFTAARKLNPDNVAATINLEFNRSLRAGTTNLVDSSRVTADQFGKYRTWNEMLIANGPVDETSFSFENGVMLVQGRLLRQAVVPFTRVRQLAPKNLAARLWLAQLYLFARQPERALEALNDPLTRPLEFSLNETNSTEINVLAASGYFQKNDSARGIALLEKEMARHPDDDTLCLAASQAFFMRGLYPNALRVIERKLLRTPDDPQWLFGKAIATMQMTNYPAAIATFSHILEIQTNNADARFNRAIAYLQSDRLDLARADYQELQATYTNSFPVAYGLGEIAWRQHATNEGIRNYQIYLANAPTNTAEAQTVRERLNQLQTK